MGKDLENVDWNDSISNQQDGSCDIPNSYDNDLSLEIDIQSARWSNTEEKSDLPDFGYDVDPIVNTED